MSSSGGNTSEVVLDIAAAVLAVVVVVVGIVMLTGGQVSIATLAMLLYVVAIMCGAMALRRLRDGWLGALSPACAFASLCYGLLLGFGIWKPW